MKKLNLVIVLMLAAGAANAQDIFITEYFEGKGYQKAIEITNNSGAPVDLSNLRIQTYYNGGATPAPHTSVQTADDGVTKQIPNGGVFVYYFNIEGGIAGTDSEFPNAKPSQRGGTAKGGALGYSGNDAIELLYKNGGAWTTVDIFGKIGEDPSGGHWRSASGPLVSSMNKSLYRLPAVKTGVKTNPENFEINKEWGNNYEGRMPEAPFSSLGVTGKTEK